MFIKLFFLGRPCSGKSTAASHIAMKAKSKGWFTKHVGDYKFLYDLYQREKLLPADAPRQFERATKDDEEDMRTGFDVLDFSVLDEVLRKLEGRIRRKIDKHQSKPQFLVTAEFARNNYEHAFHQFGDAFLEQAYFIYIDSEVETCIERIHAGRKKAGTKRNHLVSMKIMRTYYNTECRQYFQPELGQDSSKLSKEFDVPQERIKIIENEASLEAFLREIWSYVEPILDNAIS
jgi:hypothetical protein